MPDWIWDPAKDRLNRKARQGLSLAAGILALDDPHVLSRPDEHAHGDRWQTSGLAAGLVLLFVVHTEPSLRADGREVGRIISVRKA